MHLLTRLKAHLPTVEDLQRHPRLRPLAHRLSEPVLWHARPEGIARGVAIGVFWAFAAPVAQMLFAAAHCVWWRGNIPVAATITFITNPFTIGGWLWLAYQLGLKLPGVSVIAGSGWLASVGWPTLLGMAVFAVVGAGAGYLLAHAASRTWLGWRLMRRAQRRRALVRG